MALRRRVTLREVWIPTCVGMTALFGRAARPRYNVIPTQVGIQARLQIFAGSDRGAHDQPPLPLFTTTR